MHLIKLLNEQVKKKFFANSAIEAIEKEFQTIIEESIKKYHKEKESPIKNLEYKLFSCKIMLFEHLLYKSFIEDIQINLLYYRISPITEKESIMIEEAKKAFLHDQTILPNPKGKKLWIMNLYLMKIESALEGNFDFNIH